MNTDVTHIAERLSAISRSPFIDLPAPQKSLLVVTTQNRYSAKAESAQVQYRRRHNDYVVVAISHANRAKPSWFLNLKEGPIVELKVGGARFYAKATTPTGRARLSLLSLMEDISGCSQHKIPRDITIVVLSPMC
jgi:deazaflavin-dependent oxidoreductase (nitroreductase family)